MAMNQRRVPVVYLNPGNLPLLAFWACIGISKLRGINGPQGFESHPRLQVLRCSHLLGCEGTNRFILKRFR